MRIDEQAQAGELAGFDHFAGPKEQADPRPPLAIALDRVHDTAAQLDKLTEALAGRLRPLVLDVPRPESADRNPRPGASELVSRVHVQADHLQDIVRRVAGMLDGIEL